MLVHNIVNSLFASCSYLIKMNDQNGWIVDCGDITPIISLLANCHLRGILLTHAHLDHIYGLNNLLKYSPDSLVFTNDVGKETLLDANQNLSHYNNSPFVFEFPENIKIVNDGDEINLSDKLKAKVIATPGHHPSCLTYLIGDFLFTGDSFIPGTKVITHLPKGDKSQAKESVQKIIEISNGKIIYPGHFIDNS